MTLRMDPQLMWLFEGVLAILALSSLIGLVLKLRVRSDTGRATVANLNARIRAWWVMSAVFALTVASGSLPSPRSVPATFAV